MAQRKRSRKRVACHGKIMQIFDDYVRANGMSERDTSWLLGLGNSYMSYLRSHQSVPTQFKMDIIKGTSPTLHAKISQALDSYGIKPMIINDTHLGKSRKQLMMEARLKNPRLKGDQDETKKPKETSQTMGFPKSMEGYSVKNNPTKAPKSEKKIEIIPDEIIIHKNIKLKISVDII